MGKTGRNRDGVGGGKFSPNAPVSRQDLALILMNCTEYAGLALPVGRVYQGFKDYEDIAVYAKGAVEAFFRAMIVSGRDNNMFDPKGGATRAETAAMLHRLLEAAAVGK